MNGDGYGGTRGQGCIEFPGGGDTGFLGSVHYLNETLMHLSFKHILLAREGSQINSTPKGGGGFEEFTLKRAALDKFCLIKGAI